MIWKILLSALTTWYGGADIAITLSRCMCVCVCVCVWICGYVGLYVSTMKQKPLIGMNCNLAQSRHLCQGPLCLKGQGSLAQDQHFELWHQPPSSSSGV